MHPTTALIIFANGAEVFTTPNNGKFFKDEELQLIVGGLIEFVKCKDGRLMVLNEKRKLIGLPPNKKATRLYKHGDQDTILGNVLVVDKYLIR